MENKLNNNDDLDNSSNNDSDNDWDDEWDNDDWKPDFSSDKTLESKKTIIQKPKIKNIIKKKN